MKTEISLNQSNILQDIAERTSDTISCELINAFRENKINTTRDDCMLSRHDNQYLTDVMKMTIDEDTKIELEKFINDFTKDHK